MGSSSLYVLRASMRSSVSHSIQWERNPSKIIFLCVFLTYKWAETDIDDDRTLKRKYRQHNQRNKPSTRTFYRLEHPFRGIILFYYRYYYQIVLHIRMCAVVWCMANKRWDCKMWMMMSTNKLTLSRTYTYEHRQGLPHQSRNLGVILILKQRMNTSHNIDLLKIVIYHDEWVFLDTFPWSTSTYVPHLTSVISPQ